MYEKLLPRGQAPGPTAIPVYQRPTELYQEQTPKRKNHGVDFNNLILLTKNSVKMRRGYAKGGGGGGGGIHQPLLLEGKQSLRAGQNVVPWYGRGCAKRSGKEVVTVNALVSELRSFERKCERGGTGRRAAGSPSRHGEIVESRDETAAADEAAAEDRSARRPLYRDILANASSDRGATLENVFEER